MPLFRTVLRRALGITTLSAVILATLVLASEKDVHIGLLKGPLAFEPNLGQIDSDADYIARGSGYGITLTATEAVINVSVTAAEPRANAEIRMRLLGARDDAGVEAGDALPGRTHYYSGSTPDTWITDVPSFGRVRFTDVYDGIDLVYYGNRGQLEYDFVVAPGIDPGVVGMAFGGADGLHLIDGNLAIETRAGRLTLARPIAYQNIEGVHRAVESAYVLDEDSNVRFELGAYDLTRPLVIDPTLTYLLDFGLEELFFFSESDNALAVAVQPSGEVYAAGTWVDIFSVDISSNGSERQDAFVVKFASGGGRLWTALIRGNAADVAYGIALDGPGNAYVVGQTSSTNFPNFPGSGALTNRGSDGFIFKLDPTGSTLGFATLLGGANADRTDSVRFDSNGDLFVAGSAQSQIARITGTADTGVWNTYLAKIDTTSGAVVSGLDVGMPAQAGTTVKMAAGPGAGEIYLAGTDPSNPSAAGGQAFVVRVDGTTVTFRTTVHHGSGSSFLSGTGIAYSDNSLYLIGSTAFLFPPGAAGPAVGRQVDLGGLTDVFIMRLNAASGVPNRHTYLGSDQDDFGYDITVDGDGNLLVTGDTENSGPPPPGAEEFPS